MTVLYSSGKIKLREVCRYVGNDGIRDMTAVHVQGSAGLQRKGLEGNVCRRRRRTQQWLTTVDPTSGQGEREEGNGGGNEKGREMTCGNGDLDYLYNCRSGLGSASKVRKSSCSADESMINIHN